MIPYGRQDINQDDIDAVVQILRSDFLTQGPTVPAFESAIATYCGAHHAVAVNSATSALHIACLALGVSNGDMVWTTPISFVASANCARYCGADVDFVDIDPYTYNLSPDILEKKLQAAEIKGRLPKVVIPVHFAGQPCEMDAIHELAKQYGFSIIEDASHAIGSTYLDEPVGNGRYSDITIFSFHPVKIITTGEGGMALTNKIDLAERMMLFRNHGITREPDQMSRPPDGPWYYEQIALGFNYRMTDIQAALGISQAKRLDKYIMRRRYLANRYDKLLAELPVTLTEQYNNAQSAWHLYVVRLQLEKLTKTHIQVFEELRDAGIGVNLHYIPIYAQPDFQRFEYNYNDFPEAEAYYRTAISLPLYPNLTEEQQDQVVLALVKALI